MPEPAAAASVSRNGRIWATEHEQREVAEHYAETVILQLTCMLLGSY